MTNQEYEACVPIFKALSDATRLKIVEQLSHGEKCACKLLTAFCITQPTLSYHMKILTDCELVLARRDGNWINYRVSPEKLRIICTFLQGIFGCMEQQKESEPQNLTETP